MRKLKLLVIALLSIAFLVGCAGLTPRTPDETARIAIAAIVEETTDLFLQCKQYAASDPVFAETFRTKLIPIFIEIDDQVGKAIDLYLQGQGAEMNVEGIRVLLRQIAIELATAKGGK